MMEFQVSPSVNNQDTKHNDLLHDITGGPNIQDLSETNNSCNTPVTEIEAPLSPVLTNSKQSLRHIARRKSRIKLMNRFSQSSFTSQESLQSETFTPIKEKGSHNTEPIMDSCVPQNTENDRNDDLEERMKRCLEIQRNKKFCYDIAKNLSNIPSKTNESCSSDFKIIELPVDVSKTFVSKTSVENKENYFNFKVPESPISGTKCKNKIEQKFEPNTNLNVGFETGSGKKINLSERALKRAAKLFDDIIELPSNSSVVLSINSESESNTLNKTKSNQTEQNLSNIGFKTANGNTLKISETFLQKSKKLFDDVYDLSKYDENCSKSKQNLSNITFKTTTENSLNIVDTFKTTKNLFDEISDSSPQETESKSDTSDHNLFDENDTSAHKKEFKIPDPPLDKNENLSPTKNLFSQITDTQMCWAAESAECVVDFGDSQWSPSPKNKSPKKTQIFDEKNKEVDFLSPEGENFFGNLTVCEDGTVMSRNHLSFEESEEEIDKISEELSIISETKMKDVHFSTASGKNLKISEQELKKAEKMFEDINEHCNEENNKNLCDSEENVNLNIEKNMEFGFSTAAGNKIKISEQALKKVEKIFQDIDQNNATDFVNQSNENLLTRNVENNEKENICGFFSASETNLETGAESLIKVQNIFSGCDNDENIPDLNVINNETVQDNENFESSGCNFDKSSVNLLQNSEQNLEMSLLASVSIRSEFFTDNIDNSAENINLNERCPQVISLVPYNSSSSQNNEDSSSFSTEQDKNIEDFNISNTKNDELDSCCGFMWDDALKSLKIHELYKRSFKYIEKDIKNNIFYPISFTFGDILKSKEYKNKNYKYSLRNRRRSGVIYSNREKKRKSNSQTSSQNLNISMTTRSKRKSTNEELFPDVIIIDKPSTRGRKRRSIDSALNTSNTEQSVPNNNICINIDTNVNIKKTIQNLEDEFLNSIENSLNLSETECCSYNKENYTDSSKNSPQNVTCEIKFEHKNVLQNVVLENETNISNNNSKISNTVILEENKCINNFNNHKIYSNFGFSTASGNKITISEESLNKVQKLFEDDIIDCTIKNNSDFNSELQNSDNKFEENFDDFSSLNMKTTASVGFSVDSDKTVTITETAVQKLNNLLQDYNVCEDLTDKNTETSKNVSSFGFATASGKKVSISEDALKKAKNIFQDCEVTEEYLQKNNDKTDSFEFSTAFDNKVSIPEGSLQKTKNILQNCDVGDEITEKEFVLPKNSSDFGFATASGKKVFISEDALKKAKNVFEDCENTDKTFEENIETNTNNSCSFATASGKNVLISETALKKAENVFQDCNIEDHLETNLSSYDFSSAPGKNVEISEESLKKTKNIFQDCEIEENLNNMDIPESSGSAKSISSFGFASASGKKVSVSEEALKKAKNLFKDCDENNFNENTPTNLDASNKISSFGFASASGKKVSISEEALKKAKNLFQDCDEDNFNKTTNTSKNLDTFNNISSFGFASASGKKVSISEEALKKAKNFFQDCDEDNFNKTTNTSKNLDASNNISSFGFASASGKKVSISEEALKKAKNLFQDCDEDSFNKTTNTSKNLDASNNISSFGFASASGKKVSISEEALKKAKNLFQDCDEDNFNKTTNTSKNLDASNNISSFGFASVSGKQVSISEEALKKAKNLIQDCIEDNFNKTTNTSKNLDASNNISSFGFASASGKKVSVSEEALKKAKNLFQDCDEDNFNKTTNTSKNLDASNNISSFGFASASGKKVSISEEALKKAKNLFQDCDEDNFNKNINTSKNLEASNNISSFGFASASGKKVSISEEALKKAKNLFQDCNVDNFNKNINIPKNLDATNNISSFGFASASGKKVSISEEALKKAKNLFQDCDEDNFNKTTNTSTNLDTSKNTSSFGFDSASGNKISVSEGALMKAKTIFEDVTNEEINYSSPQTSVESGFATNSDISEETLNKIKNISSEDSANILSKNEENIDEITNLKRKRNVSEHSTPNNIVLQPDSVQKLSAKRANKSFSSPQTSSNDSTPISRNKNVRNLKKRSLGHGIASCKQINIEENSLKRAKLVFDDVDAPKKTETTINNNNLLTYSPVIKTPTVSKSAPSISTQSLLNSSISIKETNQIIKQNLSQTKISPLKKICLEENQDSPAFQFRESTSGNVKKWTNDLQKEIEMLKIKMSVIESRMMMMNKQQEIIESGSSDYRRQRPGHLFTQKLNNRSRKSLKEAVNNRRPQKNTHQICLNMGLNPSLLNITPENSSSLHFHVPWWVNDNRTYPAVIRTEDGALIIPNQQNFVGVTEIERAFIAMPGVDPTLVTKKWVSNHYRWIVWKLASMERNYPDVFKDYLSVENVIGQLKYRYDREIDRAQRPAIRKIVECDDTPAKRMVLCVAGIIKTESQHELELTDGWYSIRTIIDLPLNSLIEKQVIRIGMKLMTQGAELLNCEGCCPLELPSNVRLQIHYNSTRRAAWHLKLGFYPHPGPLRISLRMISGSGGPVGGLIAFIARVYPISFMERSDVSTTWRNQRAEMRRANQWEAEYTNTMESVQAKVEEELEKEWREREKRKGKLKIKDVRGVQCGKTLYQFLEESNDPDSVKEILTSAQISYLQEYQAQLNMDRQSELSTRLRERLSKEKIQPRNVSPVLKLLLVDVQSPYHSRMMSIWRPTESHSQILKEGIIVNIYNVTAKNNGTLSSIPRTQFEENSDYDPTRYATLNRVVTPINQTCNADFKAQFGEYDTVGMVVSVDVQQTMQTMWLADENQRFLTIVVREGPNSCTLFDGVSPGKIISVMNLIHKKPIKSYGEAIGNHYTVLSSYPQHTYLQEYMQEFIENLPQDVDQYLEECQNIVEGFSSNTSRNNFSLNSYINCSEEQKETFCKKLMGLENSQQNKPDSLTLSDEEMALLDTQQY